MVYHSRRSLSCARIWGNIVWATEHLKRWVAFDAIALAEISLLCAINLSKLDVLLLQCGCGFFVFRGKCFAVATVE
jgi:hypothetical protein